MGAEVETIARHSRRPYRRSESDRRIYFAARLAKAIRLYFLVCRPQGVSSEYAARELAVCRRTIFRYLSALKIAGAPIHYDIERRVHRTLSRWRPENIAAANGREG